MEALGRATAMISCLLSCRRVRVVSALILIMWHN